MLMTCLQQVFNIEDSGAVKQVCSNVVMGSDRPTLLHGGAVLGVGFDRKIRPGTTAIRQMAVFVCLLTVPFCKRSTAFCLRARDI